MAGFKLDIFRGIRPGRSALKLPVGEAQTAANVKLGSGDIEPWVDEGDPLPVVNTYFNRTIHLFEADTNNPKWLEWNTPVSVARGTVKGDASNRTYYTGDGFPKMTYSPIATSGGAPYPSQFRKLGIPAPNVAPTVVGAPLPEKVDPALRRTLPGSLVTKGFEIVFVNYTVYPGTGTPDEQWNLRTAAASGDITFNIAEGDAVKVIEVIDEDTVTLGSATGSGAFAVTGANDKTAIQYWQPMDENGTTREADWVGWRIPDGIQATIIGHLLRVGDVIRVTRLDYSTGLLFPFTAAQNFFEQDWTSAVSVTVGGSTFFQTPNGRVAASVDGTADFPALAGGFYYDVDRTASTSDILEDRSYVYTYVSALGEEGPPSPVSAPVAALDGDTMTITGLELPPTQFYDITKMRLYRTNATEAGTELQFVREFDVATETTENVFGAALGEVIATTTWEAPDPSMQGITSMPNGMMVGFKGKNVYFCEPFFPHAWPPEYDQAIDYEIVALARFGNSIAILTEGVPYILTGSHPRNANIRPYEINQACVSPLSVASSLDRVIYASPDGLIELGINGAKNVTDEYVGKAEWASFEPTTIVGEFHDGKYFGFFGGEAAVPQPPFSLFLTGSVVTPGSLPDESDIVAGGATIILTVASDTWLAAGAPFEGTRQTIIDSFLSDSDFITGWNTTMLPNIPVTDVVRTSATQVTITLTAQAAYSLIAPETISLSLPGSVFTGGVGIAADVTFTVNPLEDYSSEVIAFTDFFAAGNSEPFAINSGLDILDWDSYEGVAQSFKDETDITAGAYSLSQDRWLAVGVRDGAAPVKPNTLSMATSDDRGVTWTSRFHAFIGAAGKGARSALRWDLYDLYVVCGDSRSIQVSADAETWLEASVDALIPAGQSLNSLVIADSGTEPYIYAACGSANFLVRSPDLSLYPPTNTWVSSTVTYVSATGTKLMAPGDAKILSVGQFNTDMEIAETVQGALSGTSVGAISSFNCTGLVMGNDLWVGVSNDFRIVTVANGSEGTIGNWSAPSSSKAANTVIYGLTYDKGNGIKPGYGYIAFGEETVTNKGVIYTSPDGATWTLRHTQLESVPIKAAVTKYPEDQRDDVKLNFAPTFNGAQAPTQLGNSTAEYDFSGLKGAANGTVLTEIVVYHTPADTILKIDGSTSGGPAVVSETPEAPATIFNLNESADEVRIALVSIDVGTSSDAFHGVAAQVGSGFTDGAFFAPVPYFDIGYAAKAYARAFAFNMGTSLFESEAICTFAYTFRKAGYNDLTVTYKVRAHVTAEATGT